jgi:hypothetical protein
MGKEPARIGNHHHGGRERTVGETCGTAAPGCVFIIVKIKSISEEEYFGQSRAREEPLLEMQPKETAPHSRG